VGKKVKNEKNVVYLKGRVWIDRENKKTWGGGKEVVG